MEKVNVGIVGVGWVSQVVHLPILLKMPEARVAAICDRDRSRLRLVGEKFGVTKLYQDVGQMLASEQLDAVVIATPTDSHCDIALAALEAGKDVLVEKPIARSHQEAAQMTERARELKRKLMVGMNHRFRPDTMILKSFLEGKEIGKVYYVKAGWLRKRPNDRTWVTDRERAGGGVFLDMGIVMLDLALWAMGYPEAESVQATHFSHTTRKVEDTSVIVLRLKGGAAVNIEVSWSMVVHDDQYYCHIFGTEGTASLNPLRVHKELHGNLVNLAPAKMDPPQSMFRKSYENELKHFIGAVQNLHPVVSTGEEGTQRMRIADAVYRSARLGREVRLR